MIMSIDVRLMNVYFLVGVVNYPARRAGVKKRTSLPEALKICPGKSSLFAWYMVLLLYLCGW